MANREKYDLEVEKALWLRKQKLDAEIERVTGKTRAQIEEELEAGRKEYLQGRSIDDVFTPITNYRGLATV